MLSGVGGGALVTVAAPIAATGAICYYGCPAAYDWSEEAGWGTAIGEWWYPPKYPPTPTAPIPVPVPIPTISTPAVVIQPVDERGCPVGAPITVVCRNPAQDKPLSPHEIDKLEKLMGIDIHDIKNHEPGLDVYKDQDGNCYIKPKGSKCEGEPLGVNINDPPPSSAPPPAAPQP